MRTTEQKRCKSIISVRMYLLKITTAVLKKIDFHLSERFFVVALDLLILSSSNRCLENTIAVLPITSLIGYLYR